MLAEEQIMKVLCANKKHGKQNKNIKQLIWQLIYYIQAQLFNNKWSNYHLLFPIVNGHIYIVESAQWSVGGQGARILSAHFGSWVWSLVKTRIFIYWRWNKIFLH